MFDDLAYLVLSRTTTVSNGKKSYNNMDSVCNTSKYHPKFLVSTFKVNVIQGHEIKAKLEILFFGSVIHVLCQFFVKNAKNGPRTLFGP